GVLQEVYTGAASGAAVSQSNLLTFFEDDTATGGAESATGSVNRILIFHGVLSATDVALLSGGAPTTMQTDVNEGGTATAFGSWRDPGTADVVTLTASVGTVTKNADGSWLWSFATSDGPDQSQTVTITATDSDGASSSTSFALVVHNAAPTVTASPVTVT